ncbi:MAG: ABC transporter permease [Kangiellaceae bacterium]|nr:ABC transporter permease [Kangiellaceae bacterium]
MSLPEIGVWELSLTLIPVLFVGMIFWQWKLPLKDLIVATLRMVVQLLLIGFLLVYLFKQDDWWLGLVLMGFMLIISGWIAMRPLLNKTRQHFTQLSISLLLGCGFILILILVAVLKLEPWYQPRYVIPLAGMLLANTMNGLSLAGERFQSELEQKKTLLDARNAAFNTAMIPQINSLLAVGLVALPGMMTGQILSGVSPLIAVRYQIIIMAAILCSAAFSVAVYLVMRVKEMVATNR